MVVLNCRVGILYIIESSCPKNPLSMTTCLFYFGFSLLETHQSDPESDIRQTLQVSCHGDSSVLVRSRISDWLFRWAVTETEHACLESDIRQTLQVSCHWPSSSDTSVSSEVNNVLFPIKNGVWTASPERFSRTPPPPAVRLWWRFKFQLKHHFLPLWS